MVWFLGGKSFVKYRMFEHLNYSITNQERQLLRTNIH